MRHSFKYPLPETALVEFSHPVPSHQFARPARHDGEIIAANGYVVLRAHRGAWMDRDFPEASQEALERLGKLPWGQWPRIAGSAEWEPLDAQSGRIYDHAMISPFLLGKIAPSPVVCVAEVPVRLSLLQLVARLPRAEVYTGPSDREHPLWFRFSGGRGCIARDPSLKSRFSWTIFAPRYDVLHGTRIPKKTGPTLGFKDPNWPPPDLSE